MKSLFRTIVIFIVFLLVQPLFAADAAREAALTKRARGWVETLNSGDFEALERFAQQNFSPAMLARRTVEERRTRAKDILDRFGKLAVDSVAAINDEIVVNTKAAEAVRLEIHFVGLNDAPYLIDSMSLRVEQGGNGGGRGAANLPALSLPKGATKEQIGAAADQYLRDLEAKDVFSGNVLVARGGEVLFEGAYGQAERSFGVKNRLSTRFNVGSITKDFTRIAIAQLAAAGKIDLNAPIIKYLPDYPNPEVAKKITTQQIAFHKAGLGDIVSKEFFHSNPRLFRSPKAFIDLCAKDPLAFEPGTSTKYSNYGYAVLAAIIESASGESYFDYVTKHVFEPAGMIASGFFDTSIPVPDVARGYSRELVVPGEPPTLRDNIFALAARAPGFGDSKSTVRDLYSYHRAMADSKLLPREWTRWFSTGQIPNGAAGGDAPPSGAMVAGGAPGCSAIIAASGDDVVIVLSNLDPPVGEDLGGRVFFPALQATR